MGVAKLPRELLNHSSDSHQTNLQGTYHHQRQVALGDETLLERSAQGGEGGARFGRHQHTARSHVQAMRVHGGEINVVLGLSHTATHSTLNLPHERRTKELVRDSCVRWHRSWPVELGVWTRPASSDTSPSVREGPGGEV